jgi:hypothetical protein
VSDEKTILLYALSTLAQTCAALAAFVGAVGLFRLQSLRDRRRDLMGDIVRSMGHRPAPEEAVLVEARRQAPDRPGVAAFIQEWEPIPGRLRQSRWSLMVFEVWNLLVIGATLVGFNYVSALVSRPALAFWVLWVAVVGTVGVTVYCVFVWTEG